MTALDIPIHIHVLQIAGILPHASFPVSEMSFPFSRVEDDMQLVVRLFAEHVPRGADSPENTVSMGWGQIQGFMKCFAARNRFLFLQQVAMPND